MSDKNPVPNDKALTAGVYFNPGSVLARARAYGAAQSPVLGYSNVVCAALEEYLTARGWGPQGAAVIASEEAALLLQAKRLGVDIGAVLRTAVLSVSPATAQAGRPVPGGEHAASGDPAEILRPALSEAQQPAEPTPA